MVASTTSAGALLLLLIQLSLPTTVIGSGCTEDINNWVASKDCKSYYWCSWGVAGQFYDCVHSELFDETSSQCVNPERTNFQCPGLNWREDDLEGEEAVGYTTTTAGTLVNPLKMYCSTSYIGQYYNGECGAVACPNGYDSDCPDNQRCYSTPNCKETTVVETPPPAPVDLSKIDFGNPGDWYCSATWNPPEYTGSCGYPCPNQSDQACPSGQKCFANQPNCQDVGLTFMGWTDVAKTAISEVSEGALQDTDKWCGNTFDDMASKCAVACPNGTDDECPGSEKCFADSPCVITSAPTSPAPSSPTFSPKPTISPKPTSKPTTSSPTVKPTRNPTQSPTPDRNPNNAYCKSGWDGQCGKACPTGFNDECDLGQFCFQHQADCKDAETEMQALASSRWCGTTFDDMSNRCHKECPNGTDEECDSGEKCFADSQCATAGTTAEIEAKMAAAIGKLWCGKTYRHLVENCSKECPNGTDDECGEGMVCFNMSEEETSCSDEGVGITEKIDPANMWCGETWLHMLENCPKACPDGSDEECGDGMTCYDMSNEEKKCLYVGYGVKEKDDPSKRFCGNDFAHMQENCPKKCPSGANDECPGDMKCFSNSECQVEGVGVVAATVSDPSTMFCGSKFEDAAKCGTACPSGGTDGECPSGETCYADVVCGKVQTSVTAISRPAEEPKADVSEPIEETESLAESSKESATERPPITAEEPTTEVSTPVEEPTTEEAIKESDPSTMYCGSKFQDASKCSTACPSGGTGGECPSGESCYADVVCGQVFTVVSETETESEEEPPSKAEIFMNIVGGEPQPTEIETEQQGGYEANYQPSSDSTLMVENLEVILYGMNEMTATHVYAFERHTATYLEDFYNTDSSTNNAVRDSVANFDTSLDVLKVEGPSRRNLRARRTLVSEGFRMIYVQRISYDADLTISLEQVLEYPFSTSNRRNDYVEYLKAQEPHLFSSLSAVSAIILTDDMFVEDGAPLEADTTNSGNKFKGFKCHHTGLACPSGECNDGDICMFFSEENGVTSSQQQPTITEPGSDVTSSQQQPITETAPTHESKPDASNILDSVLDNQVIDSGSIHSDSTRHGMTDVYAEMVIHGTNLVVAEHLKDWETFTSVYLQNFYNSGNMSRDYVQSSVNSVKAQIEMLSVDFGTSEVRSTAIKFKIPISWETTDDSISFITIVSQPFITKEYRQLYIEHMKSYLPGTFSVVTDVSSLSVQSQNDVPTSEYVVSNTFFCGEQWPVDCSGATHCNHADDCPSSQGCFASSGCLAREPDDEVVATINDEESTSTAVDQPSESTERTPCSLCRIDQVISSYNEVTFNRKVVHCAGAFEYVSKFEEGSASCVSAKDALAEDCCADISNDTTSGNTSLDPVAIDAKPEPVVINTVDNSESSNESSHVGSETSTETAVAINDQWILNQSGKPVEESTPRQENKGTDEDFTKAAWFGEWERHKMTSSSCTKSVGAATLISVIVLELILA